MKYRFLEDIIYSKILSGEIVASNGQLLPERELAEYFQTSRTTIRKAIDSLCSQGVLIRRHGRGTFVKTINDAKYSQSIYSVTRCAQNYKNLGYDPIISVLEKQIVSANEIISSYLKVPHGGSVLQLKKLYKANRQILNVSVSWISLDTFPGIEHEDFSSPIINVLNQKYKIQPQKTENTVEAVLPPTDIAEHLKISTRTPILLFESITSGLLDGHIVPIEYFKTYHRTDYLRFSYEQKWEGIDS